MDWLANLERDLALQEVRPKRPRTLDLPPGDMTPTPVPSNTQALTEIAHEFNNILMTVGGFAELAQAALEDGHPAAEHLQTIRCGAERLSQLSRKLLAHVRAASTRPQLQCLNDLLRALEPDLRRCMAERGELLLDLDGRLGQARLDAGLVEQVLVHALERLAVHLPAGAAIVLRTANLDLGAPQLQAGVALPAGRYVELALVTRQEDDGRHRGLARFFLHRQAEAPPDLGAEVIEPLVHRMGGYMLVQTSSGSGTEFRVLFPLIGKVAQEPVPQTPLSHEEWRGQETVLLVEDEEPVRRFVADILQLKGYTVLEAKNGADALHVHDEHLGGVDVLLTDVSMPVMGGCELAKRMRERRPELRVVFMSGYGYEAMSADGTLGEAEEFLAKPFTMRTLLETLRRV